MTRAFVLAFVLLATAASAPAQNADATGSPNFQFPLVKGTEGLLSQSQMQPNNLRRIRRCCLTSFPTKCPGAPSKGSLWMKSPSR